LPMAQHFSVGSPGSLSKVVVRVVVRPRTNQTPPVFSANLPICQSVTNASTSHLTDVPRRAINEFSVERLTPFCILIFNYRIGNLTKRPFSRSFFEY
jgi:hypothetical protein